MLAGLIAGRTGKWIVIALAVILILFGMTQYVRKDAEQDLIQETRIEQLERELEVIDEVKEKIDEIDTNLTTRDDRIEWLRARQRERSTGTP